MPRSPVQLVRLGVLVVIVLAAVISFRLGQVIAAGQPNLGDALLAFGPNAGLVWLVAVGAIWLIRRAGRTSR